MRDPVELDRQAHEFTLARHDQLLALARQVAQRTLGTTLSAETWVDQEEYSHSLYLLGEVGEADALGQLDTPEAQVKLGSLRENFDSSVIEMLHTDKQFREKLENNRERKHIIYDGHVLAHDGVTTMISLCSNGARSAEQDALKDVRMVPVAQRCGADERNAIAVDKLPIGHMRAGISNYLKEAMERYGTKFYDDLGNRKELGFFQWYYRVDEHTLIAGSYSVDNCDVDTMRKLWSQSGGHIPEDLETPTWLDCAIETKCSEAQAREMILQMRARYYEMRGITIKRFSVDEFVSINKETADQMFALYRDLARAYYMRKKSTLMHALVTGLLQSPQGLNDQVKDQLAHIHCSDALDKPSAALLEQLIRYATAERLREALHLIGTQERPVVQTLMAAPDLSVLEQLARNSVNNILAGARAGRTYGGCTRSINLSDNPDYDSSVDQDKNVQEAYGGRGTETSEANNTEICDYKHTGCYCCPYDNQLNTLEKPLEVVARKRPGLVKCLRPGCGAFMILNKEGNPVEGGIYKGNIYAAAQERQKRDERARQREASIRALAAGLMHPHITVGIRENTKDHATDTDIQQEEAGV